MNLRPLGDHPANASRGKEKPRASRGWWVNGRLESGSARLIVHVEFAAEVADVFGERLHLLRRRLFFQLRKRRLLLVADMLEDGVADYVRQYLARPDPYL